ncbi:MAG: hypothetical protein Q8O35_06385 [Humidesulfovibrio sp.]|uniref:hypothetical protein n=1 Tax=Humidesulfovibrio sp. TaxID=2910988 RepID=UPI002733E519|nr:hypothetical protein [Humidesulfovibrio sp.]MDP2847806.1 hypothetical protein [Humidesulfovibrio sp.]
MVNCWGRPGMFSFVFAALLLVFNWPVLSIPEGGELLAWLFGAWALAIALLRFAARGAQDACADPALAQPQQDQPHQDAGARDV